MRESARALAIILALAVLLAPVPASAADCSALARQLKMEALDQRWGGVLEVADQLLACEPGGPHAAQAAFYRARALERLRRLDEGLPAYRSFLDRHCAAADPDDVLCQDATVSLYSLAADLVGRGKPEALPVLTDGLKAGDPYSRVFAAIQIAKLSGQTAAKAKALPVLEEAYHLEDDPAFRNEICLAILRIDPSKCTGGSGARGEGEREPQFIKVLVFDCAKQVEKVKVNMPFSFAKAVIESLGPEVMGQVKKAGVDLENLWASLKKMGPEQVFRMEINDGGSCEKIEIWFE